MPPRLVRLPESSELLGDSVLGAGQPVAPPTPRKPTRSASVYTTHVALVQFQALSPSHSQGWMALRILIQLSATACNALLPAAVVLAGWSGGIETYTFVHPSCFASAFWLIRLLFVCLPRRPSAPMRIEAATQS